MRERGTVVVLAARDGIAHITGFAIEEATIDGIHAAIRSGQTTCQTIVQAYIDRARVYNGVCTSLVTADGADIPPAIGALRAGAPLTFPTKTTKASAIFPGLDQYHRTPPPAFGPAPAPLVRTTASR